MALTWVFTTLGMGRNSSDMWVVRCMIGFIIVAVVLRAYCYGSVGVAMFKHDSHFIANLWDILTANLIAKEMIALNVDLPLTFVNIFFYHQIDAR